MHSPAQSIIITPSSLPNLQESNPILSNLDQLDSHPAHSNNLSSLRSWVTSSPSTTRIVIPSKSLPRPGPRPSPITYSFPIPQNDHFNSNSSPRSHLELFTPSNQISSTKPILPSLKITPLKRKTQKLKIIPTGFSCDFSLVSSPFDSNGRYLGSRFSTCSSSINSHASSQSHQLLPSNPTLNSTRQVFNDLDERISNFKTSNSINHINLSTSQTLKSISSRNLQRIHQWLAEIPPSAYCSR
ncbi:hypothetical protein O181_040326 [Austropuccinia psidii MF-1]|uniref:Uncharacterized protein n=1 Tax=Austropuccinia psidii MF-1 TaxID=1389203 RepID=A0A9Q3DB62_9BASI|nr:hypothetical protein [Austropuccinia psidii MF-1]